MLPYAASYPVLLRTAMRLAFAKRIKEPIELTSMAVGSVRIVHLPGEPMVEFQLYAQRLCPEKFVAVAGYGDCGPAYICTERAFEEGGYEPTSSNVVAASESVLKDAIRRLLASSEQPQAAPSR